MKKSAYIARRLFAIPQFTGTGILSGVLLCGSSVITPLLSQVTQPDFSNPGYSMPVNTFFPKNVTVPPASAMYSPWYFECTKYAWGRAYEKTGGFKMEFSSPTGNGDASQWYATITNAAKGQTIQANSIAVWTGGQSDPRHGGVGAGHAIFIEAVNGNSVIVSEANRHLTEEWDGIESAVTVASLPTRLGGSYQFAGYIYLPGSKPFCGSGTSTYVPPAGGQPVHPVGTMITSPGTGSIISVIRDTDSDKSGIHRDAFSTQAAFFNPYSQTYAGNQFAFSKSVNILNAEMATYSVGTTVSAANYFPGNGIGQPDGELIMSPTNATVAIVSEGKLRQFPSSDLFLALGYEFCNVTTDPNYSSYPVGANVTGNPATGTNSPTLTTSPQFGQQLIVAFTYTGDGYTPNGAMTQHFQDPSGNLSSGSTRADAGGNIHWTYTPPCTDVPGVWNTWVVDNTTALASPHVTNTVVVNPSCSQTTPSTYTVSGQITANGSGLLSVSVAAGNGSTSQTDASGNYTLTLPAGLSYTISPSLQGYTFQPPNYAVQSLTSNITDNFAASSQVSGQATIQMTPGTLSFGNQLARATSTAQTVTVTNTGQIAASNIVIGLLGASAGNFATTKNCPASLAPGSQCTLSVTFSPTSNGYLDALLQVSADGVPPNSVFLYGNGISFSASLYSILNKVSGKALDVTGLSKLDGTPIQQWDFWAGDPQKWQITPLDSQNFEIVSVHSGKVLDDTAFSTVNGTHMQQWVWSGGQNQNWQIIPTDPKWFKILNRFSGKALDDTNFATANGTLVQQWDDWGGDSQKWELVPIRYFKIVNKLSGKALDDKDFSTQNGTSIQQWDDWGGQTQQWQVLPADGQYVRILNSLSRKALDDTGFSLTGGTLVQQWDYWGGDTQQWQLVPVDNTYYKIVNKLSGKVLDLVNSSTSNGALIQQSDDLGTDEQKWQIIQAAVQ